MTAFYELSELTRGQRVIINVSVEIFENSINGSYSLMKMESE